MTYKEEVCIDAGTENCPCLLAQSGRLPYLRRLQEKISATAAGGAYAFIMSTSRTGRKSTIAGKASGAAF